MQAASLLVILVMTLLTRLQPGFNFSSHRCVQNERVIFLFLNPHPRMLAA